MDSTEESIESAIDKITNKEQENEIKLKERRTLQTSIAATSRLLRDTLSRTSKLKAEYEEAVKSLDALETELTIAEVRRRALSEQLQASAEELKRLEAKSKEDTSKVWDNHKSFCNEVQKVGDQCDVWALFSKPTFIEMVGPSKKQRTDNVEVTCEEEETLKKVMLRRQTLLEERARLMKEPDTGDEFVRIKNAIRYSEDMMAQLRKQ